MARRLPPLNSVRAFEAAARLGSFVAAAQELNVTQPAIGRHVRQLESWLGVALFQRNARGVLPTAAGAQYLATASRLLDELAAASAALAQPQPALLRLMVVPGLARRWLAPLLDSLLAQRPGLRLAIEPHATFCQLQAGQADLGLVADDIARLPGYYHTLAVPPVFPVCTPAYLAQHGTPASPAALLQHTLIHEDDGDWWQLWLAAQGLHVQLQPQMVYYSADQTLDACLAHKGLALANPLLVGPELASGALVRPLAQAVALQGYHFILPPGGVVSADMAWLMAALCQRAQPDMAAAQA
jgi:LysR family glycine cleavage system transcriptional activator